MATPEDAVKLAETLGEKPLRDPRREQFVVALVSGLDHGEAYAAAGFTDAQDQRSAGKRLFHKPEVFHRYNALCGLRANATAIELGVTRAWVLSQLIDNVERAKDCEEFAAANAALKLIGQETDDGMFKDRSEVSGPNGQPIPTSLQIEFVNPLPENENSAIPSHSPESHDTPPMASETPMT